MLSNIDNRSLEWRRDAAIALLLAVLAFAIRVNHIGFNSLSEDETAKWSAIQDYRQGHFVGVNSEHPMLPKMLAWASVEIGKHWAQVSARHGWPSMNPEGWLRLPYVLFGAGTVAVLYLLCRRMMGVTGSFAASFFLAVSPLAVAINRLAKEETPLMFFTLLASYFYCRARQADETSTRRWYDLSAVGFGLSFASQYMAHLFGIHQLAWHLAGRNGLARNRVPFRYKRFFMLILIAFVLVNPVFFSPTNFSAIVNWLHHGGVRHNGYAFDGTLYMNFPGRLFAGVPWYFYFWLLLVKTPIPILLAVIVGSILLLRDRQTLASYYFLCFGALQLVVLSICGAKWMRYSLSMMPFLFLAGGYAVQQTWTHLSERKVSQVLAGATAVILLAWPLVELHGWAPYYSLYLNPIGGGTKNIARYFAPDEVSEFDTREVAQQICPSAPQSARLATARPMSMGYYLGSCGRGDIQVVPLYEKSYAPRKGDLIVLEPSRRFLETQKFFDSMTQSGMSHKQVHVGPVVASTIYEFDPSMAIPGRANDELMVSQLQDAPPKKRTKSAAPASVLVASLSGRSKQ